MTTPGVDILLVEDSQTQAELIGQRRPDIVISDIVMPEMDGYETCRLLQEDPATKSIPVVFVTSKGQKADMVWGQMQGAKGHVAKPYKADQIIDQLKAVA